jgi:hypothetical protein
MKLREWFPKAFQHQANLYVGLYGAPIFLVGSTLSKDVPRDIDIRVILSDEEMWRLFGRPYEPKKENLWEEWQWKRAAENLKRSRELSAWSGYPIDFQVQSMAEASPHKDLPAIRLDSAPDWVLKSGLKK